MQICPKIDDQLTVSPDNLEGLLARRLYDLRFGLVDRIVVSNDTGWDEVAASRVQKRLQAFGYALLEQHQYHTLLVFVHHRLWGGHTDEFHDAERRQRLLRDLGIPCKGVIQIGAHHGQEVEIYRQLGFRSAVLIEANPEVYKVLQENVKSAGIECLLINCAVSDTDGEVTLNVTSFDQSSSLLPLAQHAVDYPSITEVSKVRVPCRRLDTLAFRDLALDPSRFNVLEIDVQGVEGKVIAGAPEVLSGVDALFIEVNFKEMYQGCSLIDTLDGQLLDKGFLRVRTICPYGPNWGDAFYARVKKQISMRNLGAMGRLGNQIFQYAYLHALASIHGFSLHVPRSDLRILFEVDATERIPEMPLGRIGEESFLTISPFSEETAISVQGHDIAGYFQFHTSIWAPYRHCFVEALRLNAEAAKAKIQIRNFFEANGYCIAIHHRRGDYERSPGHPAFYVAPLDWYLAVAQRLREDHPAAFIYFATDGEAETGIFETAGFRVVTFRDFDFPGRPDPVVADFLGLAACDALLISNSTFSFAAAMLNEHAVQFYRPASSAGQLIAFDPWDADVLLGMEEDPVRLAPRSHM